MIEVGACPRSRVVALRTGLRKTGLHVIRTGRALEVFQVAADARCICGGQGVIAIHMALRALHRRVRPGQREAGRRVIESRACPRGCVVALRTGLWECGLHVVRIRGSLEIFQVAADARGICGGQGVVAIHVALRALHGRVRPGQREARGRVIKRRAVPRCCVVALLTGLRESRLHVIRIRRIVEVLDVARSAIGGRPDKVAIDVALRTGDVGVRARQRELRKGIVIESRRIPRARVVAGLTGSREASLRMRRIVRLVEVRQVAAHASGGRAHKFPADVAGVTVESSVRAHQRKSGELHVIELRAHPVVHGVALFAGDWQIQRHVINACGPGINEIFLMARVALRRQSLELTNGGAFVARVAIYRGVCADEGEAIHVLVDLLD